MSKKKTTEQFIQDAQLVHGNKYDYCLVEYNNARTHVKIICNICNNIFEQIPFSHTNKKIGCPNCARNSAGLNRRKTTEQFIHEAKQIHDNKYDYSLSVYETMHLKVNIVCLECNKSFYQSPQNHIIGKQGCPLCGLKKRAESRSKSNEEFIEESKQIHGDKYDYSLSEYKNCFQEVQIICNNCNKIFFQKPAKHILRKHGCPFCCNSKGYSNPAIQWLESLKAQYPDIQHAENTGEYKIPNTNYKVDGFSADDNAVFEYHGSFWHGCPECYPNQDEINAVSKKTYGELFNATKEKKKIIESMGYLYQCVWDCGHEPNLD